jgi:hypothetical protein
LLYFNHGGGDVVVKKEEENEKIWIYFKGEGVKSGKIDVSLLGEFILNFQKLIIHYGSVNGVKPEYLKLGVAGLYDGSVHVSLEELGTYLMGTPLENILNEIIYLTSKANSPEDVKKRLNRTFENNIDKILYALRRLKGLWAPTNTLIGVRKSKQRPDPEKYIIFSYKNKEYIESALYDYMKEYSQEIKGVIVEIKGHGKTRNFKIKSSDGSIITCNYDPKKSPEFEEIAYLNYKKPVSVMGQLSQKGKSKVVNEIYSITPLKETIIENEFAGIKLLKPIKLHVEYDKDDEIWCIRNDELNIIGCGMTYDDALEDLKIVFESVCSEYTHCPDEQLTEDAILLKNKLLKYVGVE